MTPADAALGSSCEVCSCPYQITLLTLVARQDVTDREAEAQSEDLLPQGVTRLEAEL